jgi:phosphate transport system protein
VASVPARQSFTDELGQLRLQVELMSLRVAEALDAMRQVLATGDPAAAHDLLERDDDIDQMHVSLTERCYDLLVREQPVASDLRLVVSVIRVLGELERIGDLALRIAKLAPDHDLLAHDDRIHGLLVDFADDVVHRFNVARVAWAGGDRTQLDALDDPSSLEDYSNRLASLILELRGPAAVAAAVAATTAGRSLDRIGDHAAIIGARVQYLLTGDARYLATEV